MISYSELAKEAFKDIPIDPYWNTGDEKECYVHRIHSYPAKFPAFMTSKSIDLAIERQVNIRSVADIFCGCGTVAYEAQRKGVDFWGCDINPVATMIAKVKARSYQLPRIKKYYENIISWLENHDVADCYKDANPRLVYWYTKRQYNELFHLKKAINECLPVDSDYRLFFLCAFSNILKPTSRWLAKSIKPQIDPNKKIVRVFPAYHEQYNFMVKAISQDVESIGARTKIRTGNVLDSKLKKPQVDLIITSPPYVTSYEYADLHQLSTLWLDYAQDYRDLRKGSIGSSHHYYDFKKEAKKLNTVADDIVFRMFSVDRSKARSIAKYYLDMQKISDVCYSMLNDEGMAFFVIGNTEYKNIHIDNARHLAESLRNSGFDDIYISKRKVSNKILTPYRDHLGKFTTDSSGKRIYSEEFIVMGRK